MKDYLITFSVLETYHGNRLEMTRAVSAEDVERAWERTQNVFLGKEIHGKYVGFKLKDIKVL